MIGLLGHILQASYLYAQETSPIGRWPASTLAWAGVFSFAILATWLWRRRTHKDPTWHWASGISFWSASIGMALALMRPWVSGALSARIWSLSCAALMLLAPATVWISRLPTLQGLASVREALALRLRATEAVLPMPWVVILVVAQSLGLTGLARYGRMGTWSVVLALASLTGVTLTCRLRLSPRRIASLAAILWAPLLLPCLTLTARFILDGVLGVDTDAYQAFPFSDPFSLWLDLRVTSPAGMTWMLLIGASMIWRSQQDSGKRSAATWVAGALGVGAFFWYAAAVARHLSHGATGSDPFCYLQMASDLAHTGSPLHAFPLAESARQIGLSVWPAVHVGYHPPTDGVLAPTVWPIGWPLLLAPFVALGGEGLALWAAPLCALAAAGVTLQLARDAWPGGASGQRWLAGGLAAALLLTSREALLRALVPMADAAAQLLTTLTLLCLARAVKTNRLVWSAIAGAALGGAYFVRHPQLPLALGAVVLMVAPWPGRRRFAHLAVFGGLALLIAIPDLIYHASAFGSPWRTESPEWFLISWRNIWPSFRAMLEDGWLRRGEFGYLWPFVGWGLWGQWRGRSSRLYAALLTAGLAGVILFALAYSALRLRDLIPIFPAVAIWTALGMGMLWQDRGLRQTSGSRRAAALLLILMALFARGAQTLDLPRTLGVWTFGYVSAVQREAYDQIAEALPAGAVVATGLNSGAIERYTGHQSMRPASWSQHEFQEFSLRLDQEGLSLFLLDDGEEMEAFVSRASIRSMLSPEGTFSIPTFGLGGQTYGRPATLYRVNR